MPIGLGILETIMAMNGLLLVLGILGLILGALVLMGLVAFVTVAIYQMARYEQRKLTTSLDSVIGKPGQEPNEDQPTNT